MTYRIDPDIAKPNTPITLKQHKEFFKKIFNEKQYKQLLFTYNDHCPASVSATYPSSTRVCVSIKYKTTRTDMVNINTLKKQFTEHMMDIMEQKFVRKGVDVQRITSE